MLAFTLVVSLLTGILFGLFPALTASRTDLNSALKESSNRAGTGFRQGKARSLLVVSEVSLALVLLIGSALLIRTFLALHGVGPGFDSHNVLTLEMSLNGERYRRRPASPSSSRWPQTAERTPRCGVRGRRLLAAHPGGTACLSRSLGGRSRKEPRRGG